MRASREPPAAAGQAGPTEFLSGQADIVDAVLSANRLFVAVAANALAGVDPDVTLPQFRALALLDQHGAMTVGALADALGVVPSTATRMCDRLTAKKLIRRVTERGNRRRVTVRLSAAGQRLIEQSNRRRSAQIAQLLASLPEADQRRIAEALQVLVVAAAR
jgi:DNA-binding MarR family transcriptional regulator